MRKTRAILLFIGSAITLFLAVITAISTIIISYPELDMKMPMGYIIVYALGFAAFPIGFFIFSIYLFVKGKNYLKK